MEGAGGFIKDVLALRGRLLLRKGMGSAVCHRRGMAADPVAKSLW